MAKPRVFISSTFYDLRTVRLELDKFIESIGYEPIRNEEGDIPYGKAEALQSYCYKEILNIDILISIIGSRFGTVSEGNKEYSISNLELKTAIEENKHVYIFVEKNILTEFETYLLNKENQTISYKYVENNKIYKFLEEIKFLHNNNNIKDFETADDITSYLREQFAGLMKSFFVSEERYKETSLIRDINNTANTLKKLVDYIQSTNTQKGDEIKEILNTSHPIINRLKKIFPYLNYKFYFESKEDIINFFSAYNYKVQSYDSLTLKLLRDSEEKIHTLSFNEEIFDDNGFLKYFKPDDWHDEYVNYNVEDKNVVSSDDLPF